jgi:sigma-B regulation protein RsbU (phosphoserine phosphatase)
MNRSIKIEKIDKEKNFHKSFLKTINKLIHSSQNEKENINQPQFILNQNQSIIKIKEKKILLSGDIIHQLVTDYFYVYMNDKVLDIADELFRYNDIQVLAVVDYNLKVKGIIERKNFLNLLGKAYGRDIYKNYQAIDVVETTEFFFEEISILSIAEILKSKLKLNDNYYYLTVNSNEEFTGIFSTKNILIYLSDKTQKDLLLAQKLQTNIVKNDLNIQENNLSISAFSKMAQEVGGDFYIVKNYISKKWIIAICDISGKGISASLLSCILGGMFNTYDFTKGIKNFIKIVNEYIYNSFKLEKFITGLIIDYNEEDSSVNICDLGHSFIFVYKNNNLEGLELPKNNLPLGVEPNLIPNINNFILSKNEIILLMTDGLIEQINESSQKKVIKFLEHILQHNNKKNLIEIKDNIIKKIKLNDQEQSIKDDITLILLQSN